MPVRIYKPTSPGRRGMSVASFDEITADKPHKPLTERLKKHAGKNNQGKITVRHRGGGHKRLYRKISFNRSQNVEGYVTKILYDPNRSANIAYIKNDLQSHLILAPEGLNLNQYIKSSSEAELKVGNALPLKNIPIG